jgi:hypothetical protein
MIGTNKNKRLKNKNRKEEEIFWNIIIDGFL